MKNTSTHISDKGGWQKRTVDKAIKKLEEQGLITIEGGKNRSLTSTRLGQLCIRMNLGGI
jgi:DNA-binding MarR family transcriptional regulator